MRRWRAGCRRPRSAVTRDILQSDPRNVGALLRQGDALGRDGTSRMRPRNATGVVIAIDATFADGLRGLGRAAWREARSKRPRHVPQGNRAAPNDAAALNDLGIALDLQDRHDEAQVAYQAALVHRPGMIAAQVNLGCRWRWPEQHRSCPRHSAARWRMIRRLTPDPTGPGGGAGAGGRQAAGRQDAGEPICRRTRVSLPRSPAMPR